MCSLLDAKKCMEIYEFCQKQYKKLEKKDGHYSPKHDKAVMEMAGREFKMSETVINKAFDLAAQTLKKGNVPIESKERIIRNKLNTGMI
ncbi:MAG: hypothetical protein N3I35_11720 [Clostridia bacterium]|nr:hypothetical protein [Clostridia bacterium]